jgi:hypothetical protein
MSWHSKLVRFALSVPRDSIYHILLSMVRTFFTLKMMLKYSLCTVRGKVAENGFKMAVMMNKLAMINSCEIILEN